MRSLVITQNITVDGAVEMLDDWFEPLGGADQDDLIAHNRSMSDRADALLVGRQTFEDLRGFWPEQTDEPTGTTDYLNAVQKYVVSTTLTDPAWENTTILDNDPLAAERDLKAQQGKEIVCTGSITLTHALIEAGLVEEFRLYVYPAVQGRGRRLFPDRFAVARLELLEARRFANGVTGLRYAVPAAAKEV